MDTQAIQARLAALTNTSSENLNKNVNELKSTWSGFFSYVFGGESYKTAFEADKKIQAEVTLFSDALNGAVVATANLQKVEQAKALQAKTPAGQKVAQSVLDTIATEADVKTAAETACRKAASVFFAEFSKDDDAASIEVAKGETRSPAQKAWALWKTEFHKVIVSAVENNEQLNKSSPTDLAGRATLVSKFEREVFGNAMITSAAFQLVSEQTEISSKKDVDAMANRIINILSLPKADPRVQPALSQAALLVRAETRANITEAANADVSKVEAPEITAYREEKTKKRTELSDTIKTSQTELRELNKTGRALTRALADAHKDFLAICIDITNELAGDAEQRKLYVSLPKTSAFFATADMKARYEHCMEDGKKVSGTKELHPVLVEEQNKISKDQYAKVVEHNKAVADLQKKIADAQTELAKLPSEYNLKSDAYITAAIKKEKAAEQAAQKTFLTGGFFKGWSI